jgi:selenocysteine lyase/cysteine desulfurase
MEGRLLLRTMEKTALANFAALINAEPLEVAYVQSTMSAENIVLAGLGLPRAPFNIVTDALHYQGSIFMYRTLQQMGHDVRVIPERDGKVHMEELARAINDNTRLVAFSLVSFANGFQHDLAAVCKLAHSHGAYVYADIVQAVGAIPVDVKASNVDFCGSSTYKWLMGDMGTGFMYIRKDLLGESFQRTQYGKEQFVDYENHIFPFDDPLGAPETWKAVPGAAGYVEVGSYCLSGIAALSQSLPLIAKLGVSNIAAHARALTQRLQAELPKMGFVPLTPPECTGHIVSYSLRNPDVAQKALQARSIEVTFDQHRMRVSPSIFNDDRDIDLLLETLHGVHIS